MKKIIILLLALFALSMVTQAQVKLEKNAAGKYRVVAINANWKETGITVDSAALPYAKSFSFAIHNPSKLIRVYQKKKIIKLESIFKELIKIEERDIIYNQTTKKIGLITSHSEKQKTSFLILFAIASVIFMIIFNFSENAAFAFFSAAFAFFSSVAAHDTTFLIFYSASFAGFIALFAGFATKKNSENPKNKFYSIFFYIFMALYFILISYLV